MGLLELRCFIQNCIILLQELGICTFYDSNIYTCDSFSCVYVFALLSYHDDLDTLTPYHTCTCLEQVVLCLHCLLRPICPDTYGEY